MISYKPRFYFNAITLYRIYAPLSKFTLLKPFAAILETINFLLFNSSIPASATIGIGTYCSHRGMAVVLHKRAIIGSNCVIGTSVVLGGRGKDIPGAPMIGDNVYLGSGCKILGGVKIGSNVTIGANSVVLTDIPDNCTVVGIPARIIDNQKS